MTTAAQTVADQDHILRLNVSWPVYATLVDGLGEENHARLTYDGETLEIMSPGSKHELIANMISDLIAFARAEWVIELSNFGSTTFKREPSGGFEADKAYYLSARSRIRNIEKIDLAIDPPPDMVVEVDITSGSNRRLATYAVLGVPEVWCYKGDEFAILALTDKGYSETPLSRIISGLPAIQIASRVQSGLQPGGNDTVLLVEWQRWLRESRHLHVSS